MAQHDVDFLPRRDYLARILGYFHDYQVAFVGTPQIYGNLDESWIARGAAEQAYSFYGPMQKGFYSHDMTLLIGANHAFRVSAYRAIGGYTAHLTEDMLTGMKLYAHNHDWKSVYVPEVLLIGEGPSTWGSYFSQQMRWAYGCMDIALRHSPQLLSRMEWRKAFNYFVLQQFYFSGVAQALGIGLLTLYFVFGISAANMTFLPIITLYLPLMVFGVLFHRWLQRFNIDPEKESGWHMYGRLLSIAAWPVYFLAFVGVVRGKRLTYVVTPKGDNQNRIYEPQFFMPHFILGSITLADIFIGFDFGHTSLILVFWAVVNSVLMYGLFASEVIPYTTSRLSHLGSQITSAGLRQISSVATSLALEESGDVVTSE